MSRIKALRQNTLETKLQPKYNEKTYDFYLQKWVANIPQTLYETMIHGPRRYSRKHQVHSVIPNCR